jgi:eukaryotic translation initiation factor 2C
MLCTHLGAGSRGSPILTTLVSSIDSTIAITFSRVQTGRQEFIDDLEEMCTIQDGCLSLTWFDIIGSLGKSGDVPEQGCRLIFYRGTLHLFLFHGV